MGFGMPTASSCLFLQVRVTILSPPHLELRVLQLSALLPPPPRFLPFSTAAVFYAASAIYDARCALSMTR